MAACGWKFCVRGLQRPRADGKIPWQICRLCETCGAHTQIWGRYLFCLVNPSCFNRSKKKKNCSNDLTCASRTATVASHTGAILLLQQNLSGCFNRELCLRTLMSRAGKQHVWSLYHLFAKARREFSGDQQGCPLGRKPLCATKMFWLVFIVSV